MSRSTNYAHDALSRLVGAVDPDVSTTYAYDPVGNRTRRTRTTASGTETIDYGYDRADRIRSACATSYGVDANGNVVSRSGPLGPDTFAYDQANRLVQASVAGVTLAGYRYDGDGNRRSKDVTLQVGTISSRHGIINYGLDVNRALPVVLADTERRYLWCVGLSHARGPAGTINVNGATVPLELGVFHTDGLGSVRAITAEDGTVIQTYRTDEFGVPILSDSLGASLQPFQFTGEQRDLETGFMYLRARYYDPQIGRFISRDRWPGVRTHPDTLDRFTYVGNNPLSRRDPSGMAAADEAATPAVLDEMPGSANDPSNWAYDIADLIALLDDPNPWIAATAWVEVTALGEAAVWGAVGTGGFAIRAAPPVLRYLGLALGPTGPIFGRDEGLLNSNPALRIGWGWNENLGREVFRIAGGNRNWPFWWHRDLF